MTQSKINAKRQELINKHGNIDIIVYIDYATHIELGRLKLSNIPLRNTADYNEVERILKEGAPRRIKVKR